MRGGFRIKPAKRLLLEVPSKKPGDEILGEARRRSCAERRTPQTAKLIDAERPNAVDLGLDRLPIERGARHGSQAALRPGLPFRFGATSFATMR